MPGISDNKGKALSKLYVNLWGKTAPYKALYCHMIDAGTCAEALLSSHAYSALTDYLAFQWECTPEEAISFTAYLIALHDIGKATPQFQMQSEEQLTRLRQTNMNELLPDQMLKPVRHEFLSQTIARRIWRGNGENRRISDAYACVLSLHHQRIDLSEKNKPQIHEGWITLQDELEQMIKETFGFVGQLPKPKNYDSVCMLLTGLLILCDWTASSGPFNDIPEEIETYKEKSYKTAQEALKQYGLIKDHRIRRIDSFQSIWKSIQEPRDIQRKTEKLDPGAQLTIIEAPMGEGKTEAALYFAERAAFDTEKRGLYIALPTQATSNQMFGRFNAMLEGIEGGDARLLHGTAFLMKDGTGKIDSEDAQDAEKWLGTSRMGLLDENGVGTVDQAMGAVLLARFSVLRLLGLSNKVLIIDEVHAYDAYMSTIIGSLLKWCKELKIPVVLLSATLQDRQRREFLACFTDMAVLPALDPAYPLITQIREDSSVTQIRAEASRSVDYCFVPEPFGQEAEQIAEFALGQIGEGGCFCVIVNTVNKAQTVYQQIMRIKDADTEVMLFHARFLMRDRDRIEKECLSKFGKEIGTIRPSKAILVATQVVEQSLDIDFDGMISELAPIDLLLQRAGRVHRHRGRVRPEKCRQPVIHVVIPAQDGSGDIGKRYGDSAFVYDPFLLYNTEQLLKNGKTIQVPAQVRGVIAQVYEHVSEENMQAWIKRNFNAQLYSANAGWVTFPDPKEDYFFPTQSHPEFMDMSIDDGFDMNARAATRLGDPTFRIAFVESEILEQARKGHLTKKQSEEVLLSSVSLRSSPPIEKDLASNGVFQISKGPLRGCYIVEKESEIFADAKRLINDSKLGVYWEETV